MFCVKVRQRRREPYNPATVMTPRPIHQLSQSLVNRIAAGEVIERPAAVVKELVENAIDAGATRVDVEVEDGGRTLIRIIDNGSGIPVGDLPLAFASHATSKLTCDDDLFRISTMGFRGEALASIGAVSQARILSRTADSEAAYEIYNRGGAISDAQAAAGNVGTVLEVRNLFFNTPARRKFIKGSATEYGHISEMLTRLALPHPAVAFSLTHNGRKTMELPATDAQTRMLAAWPKEFHELRLAVDTQDVELRLRGIVGLPELCRPTAKYQYLYLNGRYIRDKYAMHALREAYRGLSEPGRHPAAVLMLDMPPGDVDVNVHPTKIEVRFKDSGRIHGLVHSAVREQLLASDLTPAAVPLSNNADSSPRSDLRQKLAEFFKQGFSPAGTEPAIEQPRLPIAAPPVEAIAPPIERLSSPSPVTSGEGWGEGRMSPRVAPEAQSDKTLTPPSPGVPGEGDVAVARPLPSPAAARGGLPAIQLHNSYLVAESEDGLIIIDQHALHERIMYEELLARLSRGTLESQRLLIPDVIDVSSTQLSLLEQIQPMLTKLGVDVQPFGPTSVAVHAFPSFLDKLDPGVFVRELLERGEQELLDLHQEELLHEVLDMMACKAAVKAGDPLSAPEIEALLARRELVDRSSNCPHGRPTTLRLSLRDLEKQFKRTGF